MSEPTERTASLPTVEFAGPVSEPAAGVPVRIGPYEILGEIARGGMGVVYRARQKGLNRVVALKMILTAGQAGPEERERFRVEAEAVAQLDHPHIVGVIEIGEQDGQLYQALEFCPGGTLAARLAAGPLPAAEAAALVEKLARAMQAAHARGVVHRDLKASNILFDERGEPKVADFGLAKLAGRDEGRTRTGAVLGTPSYMAPEQAAGRTREVGPAADVYALGAVLYACLTGRPPFQGATVLETLDQVRQREPVPPRSLNPAVPHDLETICLKCLRKEPGQRYASAAELADDLRRFLRSEPIRARPVGPLERGWRWCRRNPALATALAAVLVVSMAGTAVATAFAAREAAARERAEQEARNAVAARDEVERVNERLERSAARGLLGSFAVRPRPADFLEPEEPGKLALTEGECDALWELASAEERLRLRFFDEALRGSLPTRRLAERADYAVQAAVGLDAGVRGRVEARLAAGLAGAGLAAERQLDLATTLAELGGVAPAGARRAVLVLAGTEWAPWLRGRRLARAVVLLSAHLNGAGAEAAAIALTGRLTDPRVHPPEADLLANGLAAVARKLEPAAARTTAATLRAALAPRQPVQRVPLFVALAALAGRLEEAEAAALASLVVAEVGAEPDREPDRLSRMPQARQALVALAPRMDAATARRAAATAGLDAVTMVRVAARLEAAEVGGLLNRALAAPDAEVGDLARGYLALAGRLDAAAARQAAAALERRLAEPGVPRTTLAGALRAVAARLPPHEADAVRNRNALRDTPAQGPVGPAPSASAFLGAADSLLQSLAQTSRIAEGGKYRAALAALLRSEALPGDDREPFREPAGPPLPAELLVEMLKHPLCVGPARTLVLEQLGRRYGQEFDDRWQFVRFAQERRLDLDLTAPPRPRP